jgi:hypothetical protein
MSTQPLIAPKSGGNFPPVSEGIVQGVIAEVRNLGLQDETFNGVTKKVHKILVRWQTAEMDKGRPAEGQNAAVPPAPKRIYEKFTFSNHEKAKLRKRVEGIYGQAPPDNFDYNKLVGAQRNLMVVHNTSKSGDVFANIVGTTKLNPGQAKLEIVAIADAKSKTPAPQGSSSPAQQAAPQAANPAFGNAGTAVTAAAPITDDDIPF